MQRAWSLLAAAAQHAEDLLLRRWLALAMARRRSRPLLARLPTVLRSVVSTFQVRSGSRTFAWSGLSMEASVSTAAPVWPGALLVLLEVPLPPAEVRDAGLALRLLTGRENRIPDDEADDTTTATAPMSNASLARRPSACPLILVVVVDRVERACARCLAGRLRGRIVVVSSSMPGYAAA